MDWSTIIITALSTGFIFTLVGMIIYRKENKIIKQSEAADADTESQEKRINLAELYYDKVLEITEKTASQTQSNQELIISSIKELDGRIDNIEKYLNGNYHTWLADGKCKKEEKHGRRIFEYRIHGRFSSC